MKHWLCLLALALGLALLVGCVPVTSAGALRTVAEPTVTPAGSPPTNANATQVFTDATGAAVEVPTNPQRIVAQDFFAELVVLGVRPVGTSDRYIEQTELFADYLAGVESIGQANSLNLETVARLQPDLILINQYLEPDVVAQLTKIAPTVQFDDNADLVTRLEQVAMLVGKETEAETWFANYAAKQEATRAALASVIQPGEKALIMTAWQDVLWVQATRNVGQTIYTTLGFAPTDKISAEVAAIMSGANTAGQSGWLEISFELLPDYAADADRIFLSLSDDDDTQAAYESYINNPLWQMLPAVQKDQVYLLGPSWGWYNPIGLEWELEQVVELLGL